MHGQLSPRRFGHNLGTNEHGFRILLIRKPDIWCGEGDLNPHEIAPARTRAVWSGLERPKLLILRCGPVPCGPVRQGA